MTQTEIIKDLLDRDEEFKQMYLEHRKLDDIVKDMESRGSFSNDEELEIKRLKRMKLALKDRMENKIRKIRES